MPFFRMVLLAFAKTFSKLFGLATITFFGRAPSRDDDKAGLVALLSLTWLVVVIPVFVPEAAEVFFPFLPDDEAILRGAAIGGTLLIPPVIGFVLTRMENREKGARAVAREAVLSYGYAAAIGLLVIALVIVVPTLKVSYIFRRFDHKHIAVMIAPERFDDIIDHIRGALARCGVEAQVRDPARPLVWVFEGLVFVEGRIFRRTMSRRMKVISGHIDGDERWFEITVHGTDIAIVGRKQDTTYIMAILSEELGEQDVYFSWDDSSQALEDRIRRAHEVVRKGGDLDPQVISELCEDLRECALSTEEWNAIRRQIYTLERDLYRARLDGVGS